MHLSRDIPENYIAFERDSNQWIVCEPTKPRKQKKNSKQKINFNEWRKPEETIDQRMNGFSDDKPKIKQQQKLILDREFEVRRRCAIRKRSSIQIVFLLWGEWPWADNSIWRRRRRLCCTMNIVLLFHCEFSYVHVCSMAHTHTFTLNTHRRNTKWR